MVVGDLARKRSFQREGQQLAGALVNRKRIRFAEQRALFSDSDRQKLCVSFLAKGRAEDARPSRDEFTAYGQACLRMARETFVLLHRHEAVLLASAIPRGVAKPPNYRFTDYLRKDMVFLLERFFYFLDRKQEPDLLVMDETEKRADRRFVARLEAYFMKTEGGRCWTKWIVPTPFFVSSDMTYAVQAADLCIYCINWRFRLPSRGMNAEHRDDIACMFRFCGATDRRAMTQRIWPVRSAFQMLVTVRLLPTLAALEATARDSCCSSEVGISEVGISKVGALEVGTLEVGTLEVGVSEVGISEIGISEIGALEVGVSEVGIEEVGASKVGIEEVGASEASVSEVNTDKSCVTKMDVWQLDAS